MRSGTFSKVGGDGRTTNLSFPFLLLPFPLDGSKMKRAARSLHVYSTRLGLHVKTASLRPLVGKTPRWGGLGTITPAPTRMALSSVPRRTKRKLTPFHLCISLTKCFFHFTMRRETVEIMPSLHVVESIWPIDSLWGQQKSEQLVILHARAQGGERGICLSATLSADTGTCPDGAGIHIHGIEIAIS